MTSHMEPVSVYKKTYLHSFSGSPGGMAAFGARIGSCWSLKGSITMETLLRFNLGFLRWKKETVRSSQFHIAANEALHIVLLYM